MLPVRLVLPFDDWLDVVRWREGDGKGRDGMGKVGVRTKCDL